MAAKIILGPREYLLRFWHETTGIACSEDSVAMGLERKGKLEAVVLFDGYNQASICMHVAAVPGARWMTREFLFAAFAYPFLQLKVKKILGLVGSGNAAARRFDEHIGFVLGATLKDAHPDGDLLVYEMHRDDCPWLNVLEKASHGRQILSSTPD